MNDQAPKPSQGDEGLPPASEPPPTAATTEVPPTLEKTPSTDGSRSDQPGEPPASDDRHLPTEEGDYSEGPRSWEEEQENLRRNRREEEEYRRLRAQVEQAPPDLPKLPVDISLSQVELSGLVDVAARAYGPSFVSAGESPEENARLRFEAEQDAAKSQRELEYQISARLLGAYSKGQVAATDKQAARAYWWRGFVLLLVVLAVVAMPIIAIVTNLEPTDFGTYIAPVTGIAGTVVGYWFGQASQEQSKS
jgi:hypothetical protein